ncbi:SDR family NAD(P)-dependent oxidoreductase [candidate division WWE3 bacterium]|uniref:SDR family NAD(P)-dependent oxidoreductase n=1 Tax=candidate division WWE3 bacterium TaxID=2053526 RepID=A0A955LGG6_UNCKA|nr:SDR family NAD(P)-dependent oxidoreductase [candidate division WWE3 bacterium]
MNTILITGVSRGIGRATAETFLNNGWLVYGTSTSGSVPFSHDRLTSFQLDLASAESIENFKQQFGETSLDALINNAGIGLDEDSAPPIDLTVLRRDIEVNVFGTIQITEVVHQNINANGKIISISSQMAALNQSFTYGDPSYRISKAALNMFTLNLSKDPRLVDKNISVCSFDPGWVKTDMGGPHAPRKPEEPAQELFDLITQGFETGKFYRGTSVRDW